jgi:biopolymer transport protein ExbB
MQTAAFIYSRIGPAGAALVAVGVFAVYLAVKNMIILWLTAKGFNRAATLINSGADPYKEVLSKNSGNPIIAVICEAVGAHGSHSNDLRAEVAYLFNLHFSKVMRDLTLLRVIAAISPLMGLLGTLLGLMGVFGSLAASSSLATGAILAAGIWEAILTTIMGLTLAIPALIVYSLLNLKIRTFHLATIEYSYRLMDVGGV